VIATQNAMLKKKLHQKNEADALEIAQHLGADAFWRLDGQALLTRALDARCYTFANTITPWPHTDDSRISLSLLFESKTPTGETYTTQLTREQPGQDYPLTTLAVYLSTRTQLETLKKPPTHPRRAEILQALQALTQTSAELTLNHHNDAFIGWLLWSLFNIAQEYSWLSPQRGLFFGSRFFSVSQRAAQQLAINPHELSPTQTKHYLSAFNTLLRKSCGNTPENQLQQALQLQLNR
jgi:hypothetical protein